MANAATEKPSCGFSTVCLTIGENNMADDPNRVWPSGLTTPEAEELQQGLVEGTRIFGLIALLAHFFAYVYSPWLK